MILKKINGTLIRKCKVNDQYRIFAPIPMARTTAAQAATSKPHHQSPCHTQNRAHSSKIDHIVAKLIPLAAPSPYANQPNAAAKLIPLSAPADLLVGSACWLGREGTRQRGWSFGAREQAAAQVAREGGDATARLVFWGPHREAATHRRSRKAWRAPAARAGGRPPVERRAYLAIISIEALAGQLRGRLGASAIAAADGWPDGAFTCGSRGEEIKRDRESSIWT